MLVLSYSARKVLLFSLGTLACFYAVSVLWYVPSTPDIGIHCSFTPTIKRVSLPANGTDFPSDGDNLVQVGRYRFPDETQPHPMWAQVRLLRELIDVRRDGVVTGPNGEAVAKASPGG